MLTRNQIIQCIDKNPGATNSQLASILGGSPERMATRTKQLLDGGYVTRNQVGTNKQSQPIYGYWANNKVGVNMSKQERIKTVSHIPSLSHGESFWIDKIADQVASSIAKQIAVRVKTRLSNQLGALIAEQFNNFQQLDAPAESVDVASLLERITNLPDKTETQRKRMQTVGVIGLTATQNGEIVAEFGEVLDLRFAYTDQLPVIKQIAKAADIVFVHYKHCSHNVDNILKSSGTNYQLVGGAMSQMKEALQQYCNNIEA